MMSNLKVHIVGSGGAAKKHRAAMENVGGFEFTDYEDADIIDICTPNVKHFYQAYNATIKCKDCIVEKPVCGSLYEFDILNKITRMNETRIIPVLQYRYSPIYIGTFLWASWYRGTAYYDGWRGNPVMALGGVLTSHAIHYLDLANKQLDRIQSVYCKINKHPYYDVPVEQLVSVVLSNGQEKKQMSFDIRPVYWHTPTSAPYEPFFQAIRDGNALTLNDARPSLELLTACYKSAITGKEVNLPILPDDPYYYGWTDELAQVLAPPHQRSA